MEAEAAHECISAEAHLWESSSRLPGASQLRLMLWYLSLGNATIKSATIQEYRLRTMMLYGGSEHAMGRRPGDTYLITCPTFF